jgi:hypothetical protein
MMAPESRALAVVYVAEHMPEPARTRLLEVALSAARSLSDDGSRVDVLAAIAARLPGADRSGVLGEALASLQKTGLEARRQHVLEALAEAAGLIPEPERTRVLREVVAVAHAMENAESRATALTAVLKHVRGLSEPEKSALLSEALASVPAVVDEGLRAMTLASLAETVEQVPESERAGILRKVLSVARQMRTNPPLATVLIAVGRADSQLPMAHRSEVLLEALSDARAMDDKWWMARVFLTLAEQLPEPEQGSILDEALIGLQTVDVQGLPADVESAAKRLPRREALAVALMSHGLERAARTRSRDTRIMYEMEVSTISTPTVEVSPTTMPRVAPIGLAALDARFEQLDADALYSIWRRLLVPTDRTFLLMTLSNVGSIAATLGGETAVADMVACIREVADQWP